MYCHSLCFPMGSVLSSFALLILFFAPTTSAGSEEKVRAGQRQAAGGRVVQAEKYPGADIGAKINAADADCGANPCTIVFSAGGTIATPIVISPYHTLKRAGGNYTATAYGPIIRLKSNATLDGGGWEGFISESTAPLNPATQVSPLTVIANYYGTSADALNGTAGENITIRNVHIKGHAPIERVDGAITSGSAVLSSASGPFTANHVGWTCGVAGAGPAGSKNHLRSTISRFISPTRVVLGATATNTVSGAAIFCARYDSASQGVALGNCRNCSFTNSWIENGHTIGVSAGGGSMGDGTSIPGITRASNSSPIVITTRAAHGLANDQRVLIAAVGGNAAANGRWFIKVLSATTFQLNNSHGNGGYTSGGSVTRLGFAENVLIANNQFTGVASQVIAVTNGRNVRIENNVIKGPGQPLGPGCVPIDIEPNYFDIIQHVTVTNNRIDLTTTPENAQGGTPVVHGIAIQNTVGTEGYGPVDVIGNTIIGGNSANALSNNTSGAGIVLVIAQNTRLKNNFIKRTQYGIYLYQSNNNRSEDNTLSDVGPSFYPAIKVEDSSNNEFIRNKIIIDPSDGLAFSNDRTIEETGKSNNNRYIDNDAGEIKLRGPGSRCVGCKVPDDAHVAASIVLSEQLRNAV